MDNDERTIQTMRTFMVTEHTRSISARSNHDEHSPMWSYWTGQADAYELALRQFDRVEYR